MSLIGELWSARDLLKNLTLREVRGKYKRTALGQFWSLINPVAQMAVYTVVFSFIFRVQPAPGDPSGLDVFALWLLCGLLPWGYFTAVLNGGMASLVGNSGLILKVYFSRSTLPAAVMLASLVTFCVEMLVLVVVLLLVGTMPLPWIPFTMLVMILLGVFALGLGMALSVANVYFRDTSHFVAIAVQVWFFATPILYPLSYVAGQVSAQGLPDWVVSIYRLNPMERFVEVFRSLLYDQRLPSLEDSLAILLFTAASITLGYRVFRHHQARLAEEL